MDKKNLTFYNVLGVSHLSSKSEIQKAYKALIIKWSLELKDDTDKLSSFIKIAGIAYETLVNDEKRATYDLNLSKGKFNDNKKANFSNLRADRPNPNLNSFSNPSFGKSKSVFSYLISIIVGFFSNLFKWVVRLGLLFSIIWLVFYAEFLNDLRSHMFNHITQIIAENSFFNNLLKQEKKSQKDKNIIKKKVNIYDTIQCEKYRKKYLNISNGANTKLIRLSKEIDSLIDNKWSDTLNLSNRVQHSTNAGALGGLGRASKQIEANINNKKRDRDQFKETMNLQLRNYKIDNLECFEYRND